MVKQYEFVILPVEEENTVIERAQFLYTVLNMLHLRLPDPRTILLQSADIGHDLLKLNAVLLAGGGLCFQFINILFDWFLPRSVFIEYDIVHSVMCLLTTIIV